MAESSHSSAFERISENVKQFDVTGRTLLFPRMAPFASHLAVASFRAFGVNAEVMETYKGLALGKEFTSGKECFPCQVTLGDVLHHLRKEKERAGAAFSPDRYAYFLPDADGPCRFGMYNKMQRLVLDRFEEFKDIPIVYLTTSDGYATGGILPPDRAPLFRRLCYVAVIVADVMDRIVWRVRPYERRAGMTDEFMAAACGAMASLIESIGASRDFPRLYRMLESIAETARSFIDPRKPRRPLIGIVGEIYLRSHIDSNQNIVRQIERFGGEVVNASMGEWINFVSYERSRKIRRRLKPAMLAGDVAASWRLIREWIPSRLEELYQSWRQGQVYRTVLKHLDIRPDHSIGAIERGLDRDRLYSFDIGTEAGLSIGGAVEYAHHGADGIVNVFPFTCMPSTVCAAILKPLLHEMKIPYMDAPYDGAIQPNRETALRTFLHQSRQHFESRHAGRKNKVWT